MTVSLASSLPLWELSDHFLTFEVDSGPHLVHRRRPTHSLCAPRHDLLPCIEVSTTGGITCTVCSDARAYTLSLVSGLGVRGHENPGFLVMPKAISEPSP